MRFPLELRFKILAIASQIYVRDDDEQLVGYVRQKLLKLKEDVTVFADEARTTPLYHIRADRIIDFNAGYAITEAGGYQLGAVKRRGMRSLWRAHYEITAADGASYVVTEESVWTRLLDGIFGEIPVLGALSGYVFHPAFRITRDGSDDVVMRVAKTPALFEGRFRMELLRAISEQEQQVLMLGVLMMLLLERQRG